MGFTYTQYMDEDTFDTIATTSRSANMLRAILLTDEQIETLAYKCSFENTRTIGVIKKLSMEDMANIYRMAR